MIKQDKIVTDFGTIYIVATPIGNLADISSRAITTLKSVDLIAAEDTRHSLKLLQHWQISKPMLSFNDINEETQTENLLRQVEEGKSIAIISDAGTPLISDPGYHLIERAHQAGINVVPVPGPCAAITALSAAGLPTDKFVFEGFLPAKQKARQDRLQHLQHEPRTLIFYESPYRIKDSLRDMQAIFGKRQATLARELTKLHETIYQNTLDSLLQWIESDANQLLGEFVVVVKGAEIQQSDIDSASLERILTILLKELPVKKAAQVAAEITGERKNQLYKLALKLTNTI